MSKWTFAGYHRTESGWRFVGTPERKEPQTHELLALLEQMADALDYMTPTGLPPFAEIILQRCRESPSFSPDELSGMKRPSHDD